MFKMVLFKGRKMVKQYGMIADCAKDDEMLLNVCNGNAEAKARLVNSVLDFVMDYCLNDKKKLNMGNGWSLKEMYVTE